MPAVSPGIGRRLASMFYETLLLAAVLLVTFVFPQAVLLANRILVASPNQLAGHIFLVMLIYFVWQWLNGGQTLAMKTWKLRIVDAEGGRLRPLQALLRYLAAWPSLLLFGIGLLWAIFDRDRQFLHDRIAGTRMVFAPPPGD